MSELACTGDVGISGPVQASSGFRSVAKSPALQSLSFRTRVHDGGGPGMADDSAVVERGVLTAIAEAWDLAVRRAEVIGQLAGQREARFVSVEGLDHFVGLIEGSRHDAVGVAVGDLAQVVLRGIPDVSSGVCSKVPEPADELDGATDLAFV